MKDYSDLENLTAKELRKLRMNLNNRLEAYKNSDSPKELSKSHMLCGLERGQCEELLSRVKKAEKKLGEH